MNADDQANGSLRREPALPDHVAIASETPDRGPAAEFAVAIDDAAEETARQRQILRRRMRGLARQVAMDPGDGMDL